MPSIVVKNSYVTVPVGAMVAGLIPVTVAVSFTVVPNATGEVNGAWFVSTIAVAMLEVPCMTVRGSTALVDPA